jgi:uncharacterized metal-binding protein YceD (DUF177 family)
MKIYLHEITDVETELEFTQEKPWVREAVERVDEEGTTNERTIPLPSSQSRSSSSKPRPIHAHFSLRKVDDVIVASGDVKTYIRLLCSRCANVFHLETHPKFSALYCTDPVMAGVGHLEEAGKPAGQNKGYARHAHDFNSDNHEGSGMTDNPDLDITYLSEDYIDLADILTEQLQLQVPFQPLCREECKGICLHCGADQNIGKCACSKITQDSPFAVLKNFKLS